tara:strand:- start:4702 stop:5808 length:1107 start_codon:yes stop_codon:yes gene_type:complete
MSRQIQGQQQKVIINLAPKPKRKKRKKKKSKAVNSVGDFRTALARSAYIQRGIGGLGFNQGGGGGLPFRRNIDANAVKLNARSFFEGERREQPNLRSLAQTQTDPNPVDTSIGFGRGHNYIPRVIPENASFTTIFGGSSRGGGVREDDDLSEISESSYYQPSERESSVPSNESSSYIPSGYSASISDFSISDADTAPTDTSVAESVVADGGGGGSVAEQSVAEDIIEGGVVEAGAKRTKKQMEEARDMGLEDTRRNVEEIYTQRGVKAIDKSSRTKIKNAREAKREALNSVVAAGTTLGGAEEGSATASLSAPSLVATDTDTGELLTTRPNRPRPTPIDTTFKEEGEDYGGGTDDEGDDDESGREILE